MILGIFNNLKRLKVKGYDSYSKANYGDAEKYFTKYLEREFHADITMKLGHIMISRGDFNNGISVLSEAKDDPELSHRCYLMLGNAYHEKGMLELAIENYNNCIDESKGSAAGAIMGRAKCKLSKGLDVKVDVEELEALNEIMADELREIVDGTRPNSVYRG